MLSTNFIYEFNIAAMVILLLLTFNCFLKPVYQNKKNKIYQSMLILALFSTFSDTTYNYMNVHSEKIPVLIITLIHIIYLFTYTGVFIAFYLFILNAMQNGMYTSTNRMVIWSCIILRIGLVILTPFTHLVFYYDVNRKYQQGPLYCIWFILVVFLLIDAVITLFEHKAKVKKSLVFSTSMLLVFTLASSVIQYFQPALLIGNFSIAVILFFLSFTLNDTDIYIDSFTECYNNDAFIQTANKLLEDKVEFSVFSIALDEYPYIQQVIDQETLTAVATNLKEVLCYVFGKENVYALYNTGFAIFIDKDEESVKGSASSILEYYKEPVHIKNYKGKLSPLICIAKDIYFAQNGQQLLDEIKHTFQEMKRHKNGAVSYATGQYISKMQREQQVIHAMKRAIDQRSFEVYYQPIYDLANGKVKSLEALLRLKDEGLGFISPDEFIQIAERNGMIVDISSIAFEQVCEFIQDKNIASLGIDYIEYNLSIVECEDPMLSYRLLCTMCNYGVSPSQINFEITETARSLSMKDLTQNMESLIKAGSTFSMDDYGTGYSTTEYLIHLPLHIVKIDKSILWPAMENQKSYNLLKQLVATIKSIDKKIVVEGVETQEMVDVLKELKCDYLQGYYYSKPVPADEILVYLKTNQ